MSLEMPALIKKYTGDVETHHVTTKDGYILTMFRIPRKNYKGVILLEHSLAVDSRAWVGQGNESLAFYLWHAGYEIWLSNARGTLISSFHEIGFYDLSSQVLLAKNYSHSKIIYIGHSQGSSAGLIYSSLHPKEANNSIKLLVFILFPVSLSLLNLLLSFFLGWTPKQADPAVLNFDCGVYLSDFSWKLLLHYLQLVKSETRFQQFDYGKQRNLKYYKSELPPRPGLGTPHP
ncbi:lipase 1-like [Zophobas morio]|uniref:lipase 1-like n=1 Tax=Zophobas morio TaxID=2755281 RepID=UPI003082B4AB